VKCPHCLENFHSDEDEQRIDLEDDDEYHFEILKNTCPACHRIILRLVTEKIIQRGRNALVISRTISDVQEQPIHPRTPARRKLGPEIPKEYVTEYMEALAVLPDSAKASAAISRRLLQRLLREVVRVKPTDLSKEIDEILEMNRLPSDVAEAIDAIRHVGNFGTHPIKSTNTGEVLPVEPGEAEWLLDVIEDLFDVLFVRPEIQKRRKATLEEKLKDAGKPPLKAPRS
jgi:hypothetical protein